MKTCPTEFIHSLFARRLECLKDSPMRADRRDVREVAWLVTFLPLVILLLVSIALAVEPLAGKPFEVALEQRVGRAWGGQDANTLRDVVRQLAESQRVAILLDRRIDPTQSIELTLPPTPLRELLTALARKTGAELSVVGNVVYLGPADSAKKLRTLVELRNSELTKRTSGAATGKSPWRNRPVSLMKRTSFVWQDLDRPRDILQQVADKFQIEIDGLDKLPHDLWAGASLPQMTATEALALLLLPFDATFEFVADRAAIRIVAMPAQVVVERTYSIPANSAVTVEAAREQFTDAEIESSGAKLIVRGTVEQHDEIAAWLKPGGRKPVKPVETKPLSKRRFTLQQRNVAVSDVLQTFTNFGLKIAFDPKEFADAMISLDQKIDIDVQEVSAEKLFRDHLEPLGIEVTIDGEIVRLKPKPK